MGGFWHCIGKIGRETGRAAGNAVHWVGDFVGSGV